MKGCFTGLIRCCMFNFSIYIFSRQIPYHSHLLTTPLFPPRDRIERATLTGENRQVILTGLQAPFALTVYKQDIFWTDWTEKAIFRAGKDDGSSITVLAKNMQYRPNDIHAFSAHKQENCSSPCLQFNGGCSHVCVPGESRLLLVGVTEHSAKTAFKVMQHNHRESYKSYNAGDLAGKI